VSEIPRGPTPSSYWVDPGRLLAGEYPSELDEAKADEKRALLRRAGIDFFLDLTEEGELPPYHARIAPLEYRRVRIRDFGCPSHDEMRAILDTIDDALARGRGVYVHCWGGIGRTGTVVGCWLVRHGLSASDALDLIAERRRDTPGAKRASPETDEQRAFIAEWHDHDRL
jgi:protein-tyrosine phosphatase